ncbi:MAG: TraR/DksA family transcriptional regulator [Planctomycetota bacterium]|nr:TraR/DksA family transcriptional regulator [Planctomycetota bacterium]MDA1215129.1 TraR/DksA family transcriptional regulator [Planctomycetota bacterium]
MKKDELDKFKHLLISIQARLRGDVRQLTDETLDRGDVGVESKSPTHLAELGSEAYEQDFSLRFIENEQETLDEITAALVRIENGVYGMCEMCLQAGVSASKAAILKSRLKAIPYARNCVECERKREKLTL